METTSKPGFIAELKRRNVLRAAVLYLGAAWALSQGISQLSGPFGLGNWITVWFVVVCAIGFPFWLAFAWFYEFTPQGFRREGAVAADAPSRHSTARKLDFAIIGVLAVAVVLLASGYVVHRQAPAAAAIPAKSIAVLPFENLSDDRNNAYFVAGMQDLILTKLADIGDLKVISRTSTANYTSRPNDTQAVGRQLGVATLLEGSVQKNGNEVLVTVQLVDARTNGHIWAESYTRTLDDVFGVEGDVAQRIAASLQARLSPAQSADLASVPTRNRAAYDAFLRAEYEVGRGDVSSDTARWKAALPPYREAVQAEPGFALAWARLSVVESRLGWYGGGGDDVAQLERRAYADARQALQLAPQLTAAQLALGYCQYYGRRDYSGALETFAGVLRLRPNDVDALTAQGYIQRHLGRLDAAIASLQQALGLDPRNSHRVGELGETYLMADRYPEAEHAFQRALAIDPDNVLAKINYAQAIVRGSGDVPRALAQVQGDDPGLKSERWYLLVLQRRFPDALAVLDSIPDTPDNFTPGFDSKAGDEALLLALGPGGSTRARPLFARALAQSTAQLPGQRGMNLARAWVNVGLYDVGLGRVAEGLDAAARAQALVDATPDRLMFAVDEASVYALARRADLAVPLLAEVLASPGHSGYGYSPVLLWLEPVWDPIRDDPRFQALLGKYARYRPAVTYPIPPSAAGSATTSSMGEH